MVTSFRGLNGVQTMNPQEDSSPNSSDELTSLTVRARAGDKQAFGELLEQFRPRLERLIELRLDRRLRQRMDPTDVMQDLFVRGGGNFVSDAETESLSPYVWLRQIALWRVIDLQRKHLGAQRRDPRRETRIMDVQHTPDLAAGWLVDSITSPSDVVAREELICRLNSALESLDPIDREILILRHCEQLSRSEAAESLGISIAAAAKRYFRALARVRCILADDSSSSSIASLIRI